MTDYAAAYTSLVLVFLGGVALGFWFSRYLRERKERGKGAVILA